MKCSIPEISWHNRDPVLSLDIQPQSNQDFYRLASGGADCHVLIWHLKIRDNGGVTVDVVCDLSKHQRSVNVVRWSPTGQFLASGDDDASIIIWNLKTDSVPSLDDETNDTENWAVHKILRGHIEDVYDVCWSPNETKLLSGSIDNTAIIWDFKSGKSERILSEHKGFVQGVAWDPKHQFIATLSSDRMCRIFDNAGKQIKHKAYKGLLPVSESHELYNKEVKYFHDDTLKSYFRRLTFSPDGNFLITPSGCIEAENSKMGRYASYVFDLNSTIQPVAILPSPKQITIVVRCCPILYELRDNGVEPIIDLPYRMIFAVATNTDIVLYDTQQFSPFAHLQNIHYTRITDLTWSLNGSLLMASSTDGFCTLVTFEPNELGFEYIHIEESIVDTTEKQNEEPIKIDKIEEEELKVKKPSLLEKWAIRAPKNELNTENQPSPQTNFESNTNRLTKVNPKRITPIKIINKDRKPENFDKPNNTAVSKNPSSDIVLNKEDKNTISTNKQEIGVKEVVSSPLLKYFKPTTKATIEKSETKQHLKETELKTGTVIKDKKSNSNDNSEAIIIVPDSDDDNSKCGIDKPTSNDKQYITKELFIPLVDIEKTKIQEIKEPMKTKPFRRIPLITLSSPKRKKN